MSLRAGGLGFIGFRVQGLGFRVLGPGLLEVQVLGVWVCVDGQRRSASPQANSNRISYVGSLNPNP